MLETIRINSISDLQGLPSKSEKQLFGGQVLFQNSQQYIPLKESLIANLQTLDL